MAKKPKTIKEKIKQKEVGTDKRTTLLFDLETQLLLTCLCQKLGLNKSLFISKIIKEAAKGENISITIQT